MSADNFTPIGITNFRNERKKFGIYDDDRLRHIYCLGKSGTGKSTLILNMAVSDIKRGNGFCLVDPHGDLAAELLNYIPKGRIEDVIYFNPADAEFPIAFNPLKGIHPSHHSLVTAGLISTFKKIWADNWGPRLEHILRYSLLTLLEYRNGSLLDIQPLLTDRDFRNRVLSKCINPYILSFWYNEFDKNSPSLRSEAISPILNKTGLFSTNEILRNIVGQKHRSFSLQQVMDEKKILICNLSKGSIGEDASSLLGSMILTSIQLAALYRSKQPKHMRQPFYLYVDEMHSFVSLSFADILAEARKYGLGIFLANQYLEQVQEKIKSAIFGNVGTLISFTVGSTDAKFLEREFDPVFTETDMVNLPRYCMYLKLMIKEATSKPFSAETLPMEQEKYLNKAEAIAFSRNRYSRGKAEVENQLSNLSEIIIRNNLATLF